MNTGSRVIIEPSSCVARHDPCMAESCDSTQPYYQGCIAEFERRPKKDRAINIDFMRSRREIFLRITSLRRARMFFMLQFQFIV
jgi:hypothetical protein